MFISTVLYAWPLPEVTSTTVVIGFVLPVGNLTSMICSKQGVSASVLQLQSSQLQSSQFQVTNGPMLHSSLQASHT